MFDLNLISQNGVIPVAVVMDARKSEPLAEAILQAGVNVIEVAFRAPRAEEAIRLISARFPQMCVCAGTVRRVEQVDLAVRSGAKFIVSPGFNVNVAQYCADNGILLIPGCATPSEMDAACEMNMATVKFFPAEAQGGAKYLSAVSAAFEGLSFIPTGGVNAENIGAYARQKSVFACGLSGICAADLIEKNDFAQITKLTKAAKAAFFAGRPAQAPRPA